MPADNLELILAPWVPEARCPVLARRQDPAAVRAEARVGHAAAVSEEHRLLAAVARVVDPGRPVQLRYHDELAVQAEGGTLGQIGASDEKDDSGSGGDVPQAGGPFVARSQQLLPIRGERGADDMAFVRKDMSQSSTLRIPQPGGLVGARRDDELAVRTEGGGDDALSDTTRTSRPLRAS